MYGFLQKGGNMLNTHKKKHFLDYLYERRGLEMNKASKLKEIKDFDSEYSGIVHDVKIEAIEHTAYVIDCIINQYLHVAD
jgi:hypothetical protein